MHFTHFGTGSRLGCLALAASLAALFAGYSPVYSGFEPFQKAAVPPQQKIEAPLLARLGTGSEESFLVKLGDSPEWEAGIHPESKIDKTRRVFETLRRQAAESQVGLVRLLVSRGASYRPHYLLNAVEVRGGFALAAEIATLPEVRRIMGLALIRSNLPQPVSAPALAPKAPQDLPWGVRRIHADTARARFASEGQGIVVATADTGVEWSHSALKSKYRGWNGTSADHNYSWHDAIHGASGNPCGVDAPAPCDDDGHGTHVTGTMVGDDGTGHPIGIAPGARWIGCRNMDRGVGTIARYLECFEFFMAPYPLGGTPAQGRPDLSADIINNSWSCTPSEGCSDSHLNDLREMVQNLVAAGILVVSSAGNEGPGCATIFEPPAIYAETFSVAAISDAVGDPLANISSRGPVTVDGSNRLKPDIAAPGIGVLSSYRGNSYTLLSGTSMASPHVSGTAALLLGAVPTLQGQVEAVKNILRISADRRFSSQGCHGDTASSYPNHGYGYGVVNALAAISFGKGYVCYLPEVFRN